MKTVQQKDIRLIIQIKNERLISQREALGFNQNQMADFCGISASTYGRIENLKEYPFNVTTYEWNDSAKKIAKSCKMLEEDIFPEAFKFISKSKIVKSISLEEIPNINRIASSTALGLPEQTFVDNEFMSKIDLLLKTLPSARMEKIVRMRFGLEPWDREYTFEEIGSEFEVQKDRARQIFEKTIRYLRAPTRTKKIVEFF